MTMTATLGRAADAATSMVGSWDESADQKLAVGLGWFSVGLGLAELAAPRSLADLIGVRSSDAMMRILGARELASGLGILASPPGRRAGWLWGRVAGDAIDLAVLGKSLTEADASRRGRILGAMAAVAGVTALDVFCAARLQDEEG